MKINFFLQLCRYNKKFFILIVFIKRKQGISENSSGNKIGIPNTEIVYQINIKIITAFKLYIIHHTVSFDYNIKNDDIKYFAIHIYRVR